MREVVYLDTSAVLRAVLERGLSPMIEQQLADARHVVTSRLSLVESARALHRMRALDLPEDTVDDMAREIASFWARCTIWEMTSGICQEAAAVAHGQSLRALDAIHLATLLRVRRALDTDIELISADHRLTQAAAQ